MMNERDYRNMMINEILKRAWSKRNNETRETLENRTTRNLERIFDRAK